ncbi:MAG: hypothetical protein M1820_010871 [Bogoriella megaspora]|nr:MAG: hypothetical protein M1820_010871 [Bogoriella megaspora]
MDEIMRNIVSLVALAALGGIGYIATVIVYRLAFHPLASFPGPLLGRITDWYSVYHAWTGTRHLSIFELHQKYGPIVRYGPNSLSFNSASALQTIYGFRSNVQKANFYSAFPAAKGAWSTHSAIDKGLHARKRRVLSQGFSDQAMRGLQPHILSVVRTFCDAMGDFGRSSKEVNSKGWSTPKDMGAWCNYMSYDVLGDICYGQSFDTLESPDNRFAMAMVAQSSRFHYLNGQMPILKKFGLDRILFRDLRQRRTKFMAYSRAQLQQRMKLGTDTDRRDFFYYLLNAKDPETGLGFPVQELWGESNVLLIAGSDTTSTALSSTFFYLLHHPSHLSALASQIRDAFASIEDIVYNNPRLTEMRFLRACIDESMRLSPPVPALLPREILPGGLEIDGQLYPPGTVVGVPTYTLHRNPDFYPDPTTFKPERWFAGKEEAESESLKRAHSAFGPFSIGPRGCIGKGVAYLELSVALARTLWLYDLRLCKGREDVGRRVDGTYNLRDIFVAEKKGPWVEFRRREGG